MAVLTNKPIGPSRGICEGLQLSPLMTQIYGGNSFPTKKPDPHGARVLLQEHGVEASQAIMIGDSQNDVLTANNAGMFSIGVTYGFSPESLAIHPPDVLIDRPGELLEVLGLRNGSAAKRSPRTACILVDHLARRKQSHMIRVCSAEIVPMYGIRAGLERPTTWLLFSVNWHIVQEPLPQRGTHGPALSRMIADENQHFRFSHG